MPYLLKQSPMLETLTIQALTFKEEIASVSLWIPKSWILAPMMQLQSAGSLMRFWATSCPEFRPNWLLQHLFSQKNWRDVCALVHNLDFDNSVFLQPEDGKRERDEIRECFRNFVDRTLALQCASPLKKFSLKYHIGDDSEMDHMYPSIRNAVERVVVELDVSIEPTYGVILLPYEFFMSKTLVKLTLGTRVSFGKFPSDLSLPALKSLILDSVIFEYEDLCHVLLPGCPVLEDLVVRHKYFEALPYCISSRSIKKLSVHYDCELEIGPDSIMSFDAPSLVSLDYSDYALAIYEQVNLASLVEAKMDIRYSKRIERPDVSSLIEGICNVETLHLSPGSVDVIFRCVKRGILLPVFNNLVSLSFGSKNKRGWKLLPYLIEQCPKLETLIIQGLDSYRGDVTFHPSQVKVLRVLGYGGTAKELEDLKKLIGESECLEVVQVEVVQGVVVDGGVISQTYNDLRRLLGVSLPSKCKITVA